MDEGEEEEEEGKEKTGWTKYTQIVKISWERITVKVSFLILTYHNLPGK